MKASSLFAATVLCPASSFWMAPSSFAAGTVYRSSHYARPRVDGLSDGLRYMPYGIEYAVCFEIQAFESRHERQMIQGMLAEKDVSSMMGT